jgi:RNA polymerase sigma-70 factor (ECF subfamily)
MAFLVVLESMTPAERVAFILHDVFRYSFGEVAEIVGRTPAACRQLASSARRRVDGAPVRPTPAADQAAVIRNFKTAWEAKDIGALVGLLDPRAIAVSDGGGQANTALRPIEGADQIARYAIAISGLIPDMTLVECSVNGQPGLVARKDGVPASVMAFQVTAGQITHMWGVRNPEKLRSWMPQ